MVVVEEINGDLDVHAWVRKPGVYLDHWAIRRISENEILLSRFEKILKSKGTVFFSWANVIEICGNRGETLNQFRNFFELIGPHWYPVVGNPSHLMKREAQRTPDGLPPCLDFGFLTNYFPHVPTGVVSLATVVDLAHHPDTLNMIRASEPGFTGTILGQIEDCRDAWKNDREYRRRVSGPIEFNADSSGTYSYTYLLRQAIKDDFKFERNDIFDLCHSVVGSAYADVVFLDRQWSHYVI